MLFETLVFKTMAISYSHTESKIMALMDFDDDYGDLPWIRFRPTHVEIVEHYLYNKVYGKPLGADVLIECDLYDEFWKKHFENTDETSLYFFTKLKRVGNGSRIQRNTTYGTWKTNNEKPIYRDQAKKDQIGSVRSLTLVTKKGSKSVGRWVMHEFKLKGRLYNKKVTILEHVEKKREYFCCINFCAIFNFNILSLKHILWSIG